MSQPTFDANVFNPSSGGTTFSWSHTVGNLTNGFIAAIIGGDIAGSVSSLKFAGTAMTKVAGTVAAGGPTDCELWYLLNPPTGLGTFNGTISGATSLETDTASISYGNVNQVTPILGSVIAAGTATSGSITRSLTGGGNSIFLGASAIDNAAGTTAIGSQLGTASNGGGNLLVANINTGTLRWTYGGLTSHFANVGIELNGVAAGTNLIQSSGTSALGLGSTSAVWGKNTTNGNLIVVGVTLTNVSVLGTVTSITDTQGNGYQKAISGTKNSSLVSVIDEEIWYGTNITGGAGSVTVNHTIDNCAMFAREYSGFNTLDATSSAIGSSSAPNTGTVNTNFANELLIVSTGDDNGTAQTYTAKGSFGDIVGTTTTLTGNSMEDALQSGTAAQTGTLGLGNSADWVSLFASFYQASQASSFSVGYKSLLGAGK